MNNENVSIALIIAVGLIILALIMAIFEYKKTELLHTEFKINIKDDGFYSKNYNVSIPSELVTKEIVEIHSKNCQLMFKELK